VIGDVPGCVPMSVLMSDDGSAYPKNPPSFDPRTHVALLPFSSGTTGLPKGVMLSHYNMVANTAQTDLNSDPQVYFERDRTINLALLPFYHIYAIVISFLGSLSCGETSVIIPEFNPQLFIDMIQKYKVTLTYAVPPIILFLNKHPMATQADLSSLRRIICSAAPLPVEMVNEMHDKRPHCTVGQAYGMTETSPAICTNPISLCYTKPASSGIPLPNTLIKIHDSNTGKECASGVTGGVCVKGPQVMLGYLNNKKATDEMIDADGWLHTGDIGYLDDGNSLFVVDRVKELIKYKGLQVPPAELEAILCSHDAVADAAVIGIPDDDAGELPKAFVALKAGSTVTPEELVKYVASRVVSYKRLRGGVSFLQQIPRSPSGKILRKDLKLEAAKTPPTMSAASQ
jgi:4-coumarate--CoA ligase